MSNVMSFKAKIKNYSKQHNIPAQVVLQNYMFERFLLRLSNSNYKNNFIIKGGVLIAAIVGLDTRSTMDIDTTIINLHVSEEKLLKVIKEICEIKIDDNINFEFSNISEIRQEDMYGGFRVKLNAIYDTIKTPISIDISTGDKITDFPIKYGFKSIYYDDLYIDIIGYNIETILAEKIETILSRGALSTRPRDFYDIFILSNTKAYSKELFNKALIETSNHRGTSHILEDTENIINVIKNSKDLMNQWVKYQKQFDYAKEITFEHLICSVIKLFSN